MNADVKEAYDDARGALRRTRATDIYFNRERIKALLDHIDDLEAWLSEMRNLLPEAERTHLDALLGEGEE